MHITPDTLAHTERVFALQMLFLGLSVLLGLVIIIQYGSPGRRMNADGVYSPAPMYGVQRYPRPISDFLHTSSSGRNERTNTRSQESLSSAPSLRRAVASSRATEERVVRREKRAVQEERKPKRGASRDTGGRFSPGWFWR